MAADTLAVGSFGSVATDVGADDDSPLSRPLNHHRGVLSDSADFLYKTTAYYAPAAERTIRWDDPELAIAWPDLGTAPIVSAKDAAGAAFATLR